MCVQSRRDPVWSWSGFLLEGREEGDLWNLEVSVQHFTVYKARQCV